MMDNFTNTLPNLQLGGKTTTTIRLIEIWEELIDCEDAIKILGEI